MPREYAIYVKDRGSDTWCLIGFAETKEEYLRKAEKRLQILGSGAKYGFRKVNEKQNAKEYTKKLK